MVDPVPEHSIALQSGWPLPNIDTNIAVTRYHQQTTNQPDTGDSSSSHKKVSQYESIADLSGISPTYEYNTPQMTSSPYTGPASNENDLKQQENLENSATNDSTRQDGYGPDDAPRTRSSTYGMQRVDPETPAVPTSPTSSKSPVTPTVTQGNAPSNTRPTISRKPLSYTLPTSPSHAHSVPIAAIVHTGAPAPSSSTPSAPTRPATTTTSSTTKSPFTSPIACPPRNRPNQILLINPTSTTALTNLLLRTLRPILPHALEVTGYNAPYPAPTAIESAVDTILSSETVLRDLARYSTNNGETIQNYDGLLVASFSPHPLINALRESYDVPVVGILEASLYVARMLGGRFGILTTSSRMKVQVDDAVTNLGLGHFCTGVESLHLGALELLSLSPVSSSLTASLSSSSSSLPSSPVGGTASTALSPQPSSSTSTPQVPTPTPSFRSKEDIHKRLITHSRALVSRGADTVILGSEFLGSHEAVRAVKDAVRNETDGRRTVNVIDPVEAGIVMMNGLVAMGVPTSKKGVYQSEREGRRVRGQTWL